MVEVIPKQIKDVWDSWNIRGMIILSLTLQTTLIFFSPLRKRTSNKFLVLLLWSSYLLADLSANFAVALIAKNQGKHPKHDDDLPQNKKLVALWAPFLLIHLGGPDTITAFSLEDNALWTRHFLWLVYQALAGVYVVVYSLPNVLWVIILLLFISGTCKYLERTIALYLGSSDKFRESILLETSTSGFDHQTKNQDVDLMLASDVYMTESRGQLKPLKLISYDRPLTHLEILQHAFLFFKNFKSLMVNNIFSMSLRDETKAFFSSRQDEEALRIIESELSFIYEGLYTKGAILHSLIGLVSRSISLGTLLSAFIIYHYRHGNKIKDFHKADVVITYTLFLVGIALDVVSLHMLVVSDWTAAILSESTLQDDPYDNYSRRDRILNWILGLKTPKWKVQHHENVLNIPFLYRRWSGSIKMFNFIAYSMKADAEKIYSSSAASTWHHFSHAWFVFWRRHVSLTLRDLHQHLVHRVIILSPGETLVARYVITPFKIFVEYLLRVPYVIVFLGAGLVNVLGIKDILHEIRLVRTVHSEPLTKNLLCSIFSELRIQIPHPRRPEERGWASSHTQVQLSDHETLLRYITDVDYDHSLLIWHIATELRYQQEPSSTKDKCEYHTNRVISKMLSDYMMYLLIMQSKLMSGVAGIGKIRFRDTLAEAERLYKKTGIRNSRSVKLASAKILSVDTSIEPRDVKGSQSKSVLFEGSSLAKELQRLEKDLGGEDMWKIISKVWLEFLFHAASHCDGKTRMELLSKGGEFINFVWLLMAHFGLGT
ncbi:hypothetical protein Bca52824_093765 [Brassica carinata]|uniref:DUF4220 domain-containing protein n=1 Tax=Brassica carinata TaxID=52824 RepID=A0A8X7P567_BRACI|nr:hypothetical protein Bca52824_093765 [Brassica carinata]